MGHHVRNLTMLRNLYLYQNIKLRKLPFPKKFSTDYSPPKSNDRSLFTKAATVVGCLGIGGGVYGFFAAPERNGRSAVPIHEEKSTVVRNVPDIEPSREVVGPATNIELDLTLYQYQTCPFCCKVRAFLDYYGLSYKVIEVNPVMKQQLKFSNYKKVPILVTKEKGSNTQHQLNDSSVIVSILGTYLLNTAENLNKVLQFYVPFTYKNEQGKEIDEVMNKYFLMYGDKAPKNKTNEISKEKQWRQWADQEFVHILSPNIYRTYEEALQAFNYFSVVGEWEKNFSTLERLVVIYVGASAMYIIGKKLKKKYALKDDVRQSLYDSCRLWMKEIPSNYQFMGGKQPNLADLAVFGLLSSIEGCPAFQDLLANTNTGTWYYAVKEAVDNHHGSRLLS